MRRLLTSLLLSWLLVGCDQVSTPFGESDNAAFASSVRGKAVDHCGKPLPGVLVQLTPTLADTTDAAGSYRFDSVASGSYRLQLMHADYLTRSDTVSLNLAQNLDLGNQEMRLRYASLRVSVKDVKGSVVAGAKVLVVGQDSVGNTDSVGSVFFPKVEPGAAKVLAIKEGVGYFLRDTLAVSQDTIADFPMSLRNKGGTLSGTIQDLLRRPMSGVQIQTLGGALRCTTDVRGHFFFSMVPTEFPLTVTVDSGAQRQSIVGVRVESGKNTDLDTISVHRNMASSKDILQGAIVYTQVVDTALAVTVSAASTDSTPKILWYAWSLDGARNETTSLPRYTVHPLASGWNVESHVLKCRAIFADGTSSNEAVIQIKVVPFQGYSTVRNSDSLLYVKAAWKSGARTMPASDCVYLFWQIDSGNTHISLRDSALFGAGYRTLGRRIPKGSRVRLVAAGKKNSDAASQWQWSVRKDFVSDSLTADSLFLDLAGLVASRPVRPRFDANFPQSRVADTSVTVRVRKDSLALANCPIKYTLDGAVPDTSSKGYDSAVGIVVHAPSDTNRPVVVTARGVVDLLGLGLWYGDTVVGRVSFGKPKGIRRDTALKVLQVTGQLAPAFKPGILTYTDTVEWDAASETVVAYGDTSARVSGTGIVDLTSLPAGSSLEWPLVVTNGPESLRYTLNLFKRTKPASVSSDASLDSLIVSSGTLLPTFTASQTAYSDTVAWDAQAVTIHATPRDPDAIVVGSGSIDLSSLEPGASKTVTIRVINGAFLEEYAVALVKRAKPTSLAGANP